MFYTCEELIDILNAAYDLIHWNLKGKSQRCKFFPYIHIHLRAVPLIFIKYFSKSKTIFVSLQSKKNQIKTSLLQLVAISSIKNVQANFPLNMQF